MTVSDLNPLDSFLKDLIEILRDHPPAARDELRKMRRKLSKKYHLKEAPGDAKLRTMLPKDLVDQLGPLLRRKPTRTLSGVAPVAIMTPPANCPHGVCTFCPGGPVHGTPQSYTGHEPAALRGARHGFDPRAQVEDRLSQYEAIGHDASKIDLIVMGGTFTARSFDAQETFIRRAMDGFNQCTSPTLEEALGENENAEHRVIGLTLETRSDQCAPKRIEGMLRLGTTRVEVGLQCLDNTILKETNRAHTVESVQRAATRIRDAGLKINLHLMPGLPGSDPSKDRDMLKEVMHGESWRPDMLKIYPCLVVRGANLVHDWQTGSFQPLMDEEAAEIIADTLAIAPPWLRIQRIQRDIPAHQIIAGVKAGNLRQIATNLLPKQGRRSGCLRDREIGRVRDVPPVEAFRMVTRSFTSASGEEIFLTWEAPHPLASSDERDEFDGGVPRGEGIHKWSDDDPPGGVVAGWCRLRKPGTSGLRPNQDPSTAFVRELKVLGRAVSIGGGAERENEVQHTGIGKRMMAEAERLARVHWGATRIAVTAGVGVRGYYRKIGYSLQDLWMVRNLESNRSD